MPHAPQALLDQLENALSSRAIGDRAEMLGRIADLFLGRATDYGAREIALFDDVMVRMVGEIETSVRAALARRLATVPNAPPSLIRKLAADETIAVAGPVLAGAPQLDDAVLVETAATASQDHLMAISRRTTISEAVTDVLVERGDREVALSTVGNSGARFSERGHEMLVERSKDDDALALGVLARPDIPRHHLLRLFTVATDNVRRTLQATEGPHAGLVREMLSDVSTGLQARIRSRSGSYHEAQRVVAALHRAGELDETRLRAFADAGRFDETTVALALLSDLPVSACERAMVQPRPELAMLIAKAIDLSWSTTRSILLLRGSFVDDGPEDCVTAFSRLKHETARKALQFLRLRERAASRTSAAGAA